MIRQDKTKYIEEQCEIIERNHIKSSTKDLYTGVKRLAGKFQPRKDNIKDGKSKILNDGPDINERWKQFCTRLNIRNDSLANNVVSYDTTEIEPSPLLSEVKKATKELKNHESAAASQGTSPL